MAAVQVVKRREPVQASCSRLGHNAAGHPCSPCAKGCNPKPADLHLTDPTHVQNCLVSLLHHRHH